MRARAETAPAKHRSHPGAAWALLCLLASCGGGGDSAEPRPSAGAAGRARVMEATPATGEAATQGVFSPLYDWPLIAIHAVLLPDGRVLSYGTDSVGTQTGYFSYDVWDSSQAPDAGHQTLPNGSGTDLFCSSQLLLPGPTGPRVMIAGGDNWTGTATANTGNTNGNLFDPADNSLTRNGDMILPRWYASATMLVNGEVLVQGGSGGEAHPEIRGVDGRFRLLSTNTQGLDPYYPRNIVAPDGRVFGVDSGGRMYYLDPATEALQPAGQFDLSYGGPDSSAVLFRPGRLLQYGGNSTGALVIDITGGSPVVTPTQSLSSQRRYTTGTVLPDGQVLAIGGSPEWNGLGGAALNAEIWSPQTGQWSIGASGAVARLYHATALLLPDATVLVAGGGAPGPLTNLNAEIYHPPYLFTPEGEWAQRPAITAVPDALQIGKTLAIDVLTDSAISRVTLVKTGSVTHGWNMDQRFIELPFRAEDHRLYVQAPTRAADAPPGYYQLFVFDAAGVPSVARILAQGVAADPQPAVVPSLASPGSQSSTLGDPVELTLVAQDPNGDVLHFSAAGLPPGLAVDADSGVVSGVPDTPGQYDVVLAVSDGYNAASVSLVWSVSGSLPLVIDPWAPIAPVQAQVAVDLSASAQGEQLQYRWNFGDGSPMTDWSPDPHVSHTFSSAGGFRVTVTVRDAHGLELSQSFLQTVYLPPAEGRAGASSPLLAEAGRLWVANPDNDSVSVFDTASLALLAEIPVGNAPRTLARAVDGRVWVTNLRGDSLSVIDPSALAVLATVVMPRASQPSGIVMSANGSTAYVSLEASGVVVKLDTASYAQTGSVGVGANPRHLALSGDGATLYVSRFITPPLPGEGTVSVVPTPATGGELVLVDTASFSLARTIVLRHSELPDFETQGRGIPNYLGAVALSPDGSQAYVPAKQDNILRGALRDGQALTFQNTVRAISARIELASGQEDLAGRIDHDNASVASAALFDPRGVYLFVALETSREVALLDAHSRAQLLRVDVGRAPQGLALSPDGLSLYVSNFMDRTVSVIDLKPLLERGELNLPVFATLNAVGTDKLGVQVLQGKQLFYDARDPRLARDRYLSCASCHHDGAADGRVWDLGDAGEGLRNTVNLRGRAAMGQGPLHWSANFDELQDFEGQIRRLAGGSGLMSDAAYFAGTRSQPLGDAKAGQSAELDALAAYVASLNAFEPSVNRQPDGGLTAAATAGKAVFLAHNCAACHGGTAFTHSATLGPVDIGTLKASSGQRLGAALTGLDVPTLRDVARTAPYLHDGSAATLEAAVGAHRGVTMPAADLGNLVAYLKEIGHEEVSAPDGGAAGPGSGLTGQYFANADLAGSPILQRNEAVNVDWGTGSPGGLVPADDFSVRWTGQLLPTTSGLHQLRTLSDEGVRVRVNGSLVIDHWADHALAADTSEPVPLTAGVPVDIVVEYRERLGTAQMRLLWLPPGMVSHAAVPASQLMPAAPATGTGLVGSYFNNAKLQGLPVWQRMDVVDFDWGTGSPGAGLNADKFSVRWSGTLEAPSTGKYVFQTLSDEGVRVWVNGKRVIDHWTAHVSAVDTSKAIALTAGQRYAVRVEFFDVSGAGLVQLRWATPGTSTQVVIPIERLYPF
ncbi:MAG: DUF1929 domain-containing protein [Vitreoscilla sp.]|nr:DUF1929 domain-containing protein [Vitreoscilla sp.]